MQANLKHDNPAEIDIDNYLHMGDGVLPLLYANVELVEKQMAMHRANSVRWVEMLEPEVFRDALDAKRDRFLERYAEQDWKESNWADERTKRALDVMMPAQSE
ncbi:MAG TPA: hypothetical protein PK760_15500 [Flavobacteriales bacterium]|nr:hypothetical protein [Flavobacteriales bacterium]